MNWRWHKFGLPHLPMDWKVPFILYFSYFNGFPDVMSTTGRVSLGKMWGEVSRHKDNIPLGSLASAAVSPGWASLRLRRVLGAEQPGQSPRLPAHQHRHDVAGGGGLLPAPLRPPRHGRLRGVSQGVSEADQHLRRRLDRTSPVQT